MVSIFSFIEIFQSTLPREERRVQLQPADPEYQFQSTLPREERPRASACLLPALHYFNPRSHERSDMNVSCTSDAITSLFQSTLPREERRHKRIHDCSIRQDFNPRSHERSDLNQLMLAIYGKFQSTLPREERRQGTKASSTPALDISIHAPTRGATPTTSLI